MASERRVVYGKTVTKIKKSMPDKITFTRVAAYARVSSGKDAMLQSLSAQVSHYSNMIQHHKGWLYVGVYADEALTGTKDTRENFKDFLLIAGWEDRPCNHKVNIEICTKYRNTF